MSKTLLVVAAEANYFPLAQDALQSVLDKPERSQIALGFLDLGCNQPQREWLQSHVDRLETVDWGDFTVSYPDDTPNYLKIVLARPCVPQYFPGFEVYLWLDADAWVQKWEAIALLRTGAQKHKGLAIVPEIHRHASFLYDGRWPQFLGWMQRLYLDAGGADLAQQFCTYPMLNVGVFAAHVASPHWAAWQQQMEALIVNSFFNIMTDQMAMNLAVYQNPEVFAHTELLPAWCNTLPTAPAIWDETAQQWVERYLPNHPIGILHLAGKDKPESLRATTLTGTTVTAPARYRHYRAAILGLPT
ncbi:MAG: hypothetical protein HC918_13185 [Oscillatoriales cyanobacterium SM2_1_8]|nr:hypothetical protein [Oscillatoriales cyanobacterium SM2_1_8]